MRILIHTDEYLPSSGPCANRMKVFVEVLAQKGHQVSVVASAANKAFASSGQQYGSVFYAPVIPIGNKSSVRRLLNSLSFAFSSFFTAFRAGKADLVITTSPPPLISMSGWLIAKFKRAKLVYDVRDIWPDIALETKAFPENSLYARGFAFIANFMYRHADLITTVSTGKVEKLQSKLRAKQLEDKVVLVSNGFDMNTLSLPVDEHVLKPYAIGQAAVCVYIGNLGLAQGLDSMLNLAKETKHLPVKFLLFGDGADRANLEVKSRKEGIDNVLFCGPLAQEKVPSVLNQAALSFIPLKTATMKDSIPTKLYEALGLGCPVLLLAAGDAAQLLEQTGLGEVVSPDEPEKLQGVFTSMLQNQAKYLERRESAMDLIQSQHSRQSEVAKLEGLLISLCE